MAKWSVSNSHGHVGTIVRDIIGLVFTMWACHVLVASLIGITVHQQFTATETNIIQGISHESTSSSNNDADVDPAIEIGIKVLYEDIDIKQQALALTSEEADEVNVATCTNFVLEHRSYIASNNLTQYGVNAQVTFGETLVIFTVIFLLAMVVAGVYNGLQAALYDEDGSLDASFDAGGDVGSGITASTLVSQWTWAATLLQSSSVGASFGISGPYWYAAGATIQILLMAIMSYYLKLNAPGAKTFFQVIRARFGTRTHIIVLVFGLFTNVIVTLSLLLGGTAVLTGLVQGLSPEFASMLLVVLIGGYTLIGGLGATFYVSYFNCVVIFGLMIVFTLEIFYNPFANEKNPFGSASKVFQFVSCWPAPEGNAENSWLTFYSTGGLIFGIVNIVGNFGAVFADQAYWQSAVAAKPVKAVWGFLLGGLTWFAIPFGLATVMSLGYHGLSSAQGSPMLTKGEISKGLVVPLVAEVLLGKIGGYATLIMMLMAVMSTGSAEIIAVGSIVIYDIYIPYLKPFKKNMKPGHCLLCDKPLRNASESELCTCTSMEACPACHKDNKIREETEGLVKPIYQCSVHAEYRDYQDCLVEFSSWAIIYCTLAIIPVLWPAVIFGDIIGLDLGWIYLFTGVLVASGVVPVALSLIWSKTTAQGVSAGVLGGAFCSLTCWLIHASTYPGGLSDFIANTGIICFLFIICIVSLTSGQSLPMLTGNVVAIIAGGVICCLVSYATFSGEMAEEEIWNLTKDIDNPLTPWTELYLEDLDLPQPERHHERPKTSM